MDDLISRQAAIDAVCMEWCNVKHQDCKHPFDVEKDDYYWCDGCETALRTLPDLPSAQQDCAECPEYDHTTHACPKYCDVIRKTLEEAKQERTGRWIPCTKNGLPLSEMAYREGQKWYGYKCSNCNSIYKGNALIESPYCKKCGARMGENNETD